MHVPLREDAYTMDQEREIDELLSTLGMENANILRTPIGTEHDEHVKSEPLPTHEGDLPSIKGSQYIVGGLF